MTGAEHNKTGVVAMWSDRAPEHGMIGVRSFARKVLPLRFRQGLSMAKAGLVDDRMLDWYFSGAGRHSRARMRRLKNQHWGKRAVIIGNGPSLNRTDLSLLRNEITFGLNRIYLLFDRMGFKPTYYVSVNPLVIEQCAGEIEQLSMPKFVGWRARDSVRFDSSTMFVRSLRVRQPYFSRDATRGVWEGATVTYVALQLAHYMGIKKVIIIGVDHHFVAKGEPHAEIVSEGDDGNHFDPAYFGKGFRWNLPDLRTSEIAYDLARLEYEQDGRSIIDATVNGNLTVFPKHDLEEIWADSQ